MRYFCFLLFCPSPPFLEESFRKTVDIEGVSQELEILDTAGQEEFSDFRDATIRWYMYYLRTILW